MDFDAFLEHIRRSPEYRGQIVYTHEQPARPARFGTLRRPLSAATMAALAGRGVERLYTHQTEAIQSVLAGRDVVVATGTASGKSLCYTLPLIERLATDPEATALLLFPTKALCQDQFKGFRTMLDDAGLGGVLAGVCDGDTPAPLRRKLREHGRVVFTNPDMLHAGIMPQHARWGRFLSGLRLLALDEMHVYSGIFGSNVANLMRRFFRLCEHLDARPGTVACSATIANPAELAEGLTGRRFRIVDDDGSPRGKRTYVFWNPPRVRGGDWRSRRSANVEAQEIMARLLAEGAPTIVFSKAKMTAEMLARYVRDKLDETAPHLKGKVTAYRGGYRPEDRREIERRLFGGELMGVSATRALELGIDVGGLDASILVGYPGTLASYFQQSGRAGRRDRESLAVLVGVDTAVNQYVMSNPAYVFGRPVEQAVIEPDNPFVVTGHLRCAAHEMPLGEDDAMRFGRHARAALEALEAHRKVRRLRGRWYHAASETPQHEVALRECADANVLIEDMDTGEAIGEVNRLDAPPMLHPEAIYMHQGDTYIVRDLDLDKNLARVERVEVDYYTQPLGGQDVHHVDHRLREKPFGTGVAYWGEVTAYCRTRMFEKVRFYTLDAFSRHGLDLPTFTLETMAVWIVPPEKLMTDVRRAGLDCHSGLRGIGYAMRMALPLFMTCDTLDFSHSIGSANSAWNAIFVFERYPLGLGFTEMAYERLHEVLPAVRERVSSCDCEDGCPCCVGKPLRHETVWNIERGEASIPSKASARMILDGLLGDGSNLRNPDTHSLTDSEAGLKLRLERALSRRLHRGREPEVFHPIEPVTPTEYPAPEKEETLGEPDAAARQRNRRDFDREQRKRLAKKIRDHRLDPKVGRVRPPEGMKTGHGVRRPTDFPGRPGDAQREAAETPAAPRKEEPPAPIQPGDSLAARARRMKKKRADFGKEQARKGAGGKEGGPSGGGA